MSRTPRPASSYSFPYGKTSFTEWRLPAWGKSAINRTYLGDSGFNRYGNRSASVWSSPDLLGWRNPTPLSGSRAVKQAGEWSLARRKVATGPVLWYLEGPDIRDIPLPVAPATQPIIAELSQKALNGLGDAKSMMVVTVLERAKTIRMAGDIVHRAANVLESMLTKKGRKKALLSARRILKGRGPKIRDWSATDDWLLYRYGVLPTCLDLYGLAQVAEDAMVNRPIFIQSGAKRVIPLDVPSPSVIQTSFLSTGCACTDRYSVSGKLEVKVRLDARVEQRTVRTLAQMGLSNPLLDIYEMIPYSFVLDWVVGVGDYIAGLSALHGLTFLDSVVTVHYSAKGKLTTTMANGYLPSAGGYVEFHHSAPTVESEWFTRTIGYVPPSSTLVVHNPLSLNHLADGLALLTGVLKKLVSKSPR